MKSKSNITIQLSNGDFQEYAKNCASLSTEKQINLQTMRIKDASPLNIKRLAQQQQLLQSTSALQTSHLQANLPSKGLLFYLSNPNKQQTERLSRHSLDKNATIEEQISRQLLKGGNALKSQDSSRKIAVETSIRIDKENNQNILPYQQCSTAKASSKTLRELRNKESNIFLDTKRSEFGGNTFVEDALMQSSRYTGIKKQKQIQNLQVQIPLQEIKNEILENTTSSKPLETDFLKMITNTSFSVNSRSRKNINLKSLNCQQILQNSLQQLNMHSVRNRQHANRKSERLPQQVLESSEQPGKLIKRKSEQFGDMLEEALKEDTTTTANISEKVPSQTNIRRISNKLFESNYSLQNKTFQNLQSLTKLPAGINQQAAKSHERVSQNSLSKLNFQTHRNVTSNDRQTSSTQNNMSVKSEQTHFNFDCYKIYTDNQHRHKGIKLELFGKESNSNYSQQEREAQLNVNNEQLRSNGEITPISVAESKQLNDLKNNFFQLNFKNFNQHLKQQLKTASNFNNQNKDNIDSFRKTKLFFSSKQPKILETQSNNTSSQNYQYYSSSSTAFQQQPQSPLVQKDINLTSLKLSNSKQRKNKSPFQLNSISVTKTESKDSKKQNKRGSSLVEQLEFEYNNLYFNQQTQLQALTLNHQNNSSLIQPNTISSSPLVPINHTPSQSFIAFNSNNTNNTNNNKFQKKINQQASQLFSQISTFTNLNMLEIDEETDNIGELHKQQIAFQRAPSIILTTPSLSKHGTMNFDSQPYQHLNCKEIFNYFGEMRRELEEEIQLDQCFINIIEKKLLINIEQFLYFLSHFWKFCIENFDKNENDFAIFKIEEKYLTKITETMSNVLQGQLNLSKEKISIFMNSFQYHSQRLILPKNLFEHIGGQKQAKKLINDIIHHLKYDISIGVQLGQVLNQIDLVQAGQVFCSFLKDDIEGIKETIVYANKELNITQVEFFLIKQTIYEVLMAEKLIRKDHKMIIIEKFEKLRAFILQDHTQFNLLQDNIIHEALMIKIRNTQSVFKCLRNKERQSIVDFAQNTFSMIFGKSTILEYVERIKSDIFMQTPQPFTASMVSMSDQILEDCEITYEKGNDDNKQDKLLKFINEVEELTLETVNDFMDLSSIYNTEKHMKLKFQFVKEHISQQFSSIKNKGRTIIKELRMWVVSNFKKYLKNIEMTEGENSRLDVMESILKYYFYRQTDVFSFYDVPIAINYFPITRNAVEYWLIGLKTILKDNRFSLCESEIETLVEQISSLFSMRWVKKKNQLYFIQPAKV